MNRLPPGYSDKPTAALTGLVVLSLLPAANLQFTNEFSSPFSNRNGGSDWQRHGNNAFGMPQGDGMMQQGAYPTRDQGVANTQGPQGFPSIPGQVASSDVLGQDRETNRGTGPGGTLSGFPFTSGQIMSSEVLGPRGERNPGRTIGGTQSPFPSISGQMKSDGLFGQARETYPDITPGQRPPGFPSIVGRPMSTSMFGQRRNTNQDTALRGNPSASPSISAQMIGVFGQRQETNPDSIPEQIPSGFPSMPGQMMSTNTSRQRGETNLRTASRRNQSGLPKIPDQGMSSSMFGQARDTNRDNAIGESRTSQFPLKLSISGGPESGAGDIHGRPGDFNPVGSPRFPGPGGFGLEPGQQTGRQGIISVDRSDQQMVPRFNPFRQQTRQSNIQSPGLRGDNAPVSELSIFGQQVISSASNPAARGSPAPTPFSAFSQDPTHNPLSLQPPKINIAPEIFDGERRSPLPDTLGREPSMRNSRNPFLPGKLDLGPAEGRPSGGQEAFQTGFGAGAATTSVPDVSGPFEVSPSHEINSHSQSAVVPGGTINVNSFRNVERGPNKASELEGISSSKVTNERGVYTSRTEKNRRGTDVTVDAATGGVSSGSFQTKSRQSSQKGVGFRTFSHSSEFSFGHSKSSFGQGSPVAEMPNGMTILSNQGGKDNVRSTDTQPLPSNGFLKADGRGGWINPVGEVLQQSGSLLSGLFGAHNSPTNPAEITAVESEDPARLPPLKKGFASVPRTSIQDPAIDSKPGRDPKMQHVPSVTTGTVRNDPVTDINNPPPSKQQHEEMRKGSEVPPVDRIIENQIKRIIGSILPAPVPPLPPIPPPLPPPHPIQPSSLMSLEQTDLPLLAGVTSQDATPIDAGPMLPVDPLSVLPRQTEVEPQGSFSQQPVPSRPHPELSLRQIQDHGPLNPQRLLTQPLDLVENLPALPLQPPPSLIPPSIDSSSFIAPQINTNVGDVAVGRGTQQAPSVIGHILSHGPSLPQDLPEASFPSGSGTLGIKTPEEMITRDMGSTVNRDQGEWARTGDSTVDSSQANGGETIDQAQDPFEEKQIKQPPGSTDGNTHSNSLEERKRTEAVLRDLGLGDMLPGEKSSNNTTANITDLDEKTAATLVGIGLGPLLNKTNLLPQDTNITINKQHDGAHDPLYKGVKIETPVPESALFINGSTQELSPNQHLNKTDNYGVSAPEPPPQKVLNKDGPMSHVNVSVPTKGQKIQDQISNKNFTGSEGLLNDVSEFFAKGHNEIQDAKKAKADTWPKPGEMQALKQVEPTKISGGINLETVDSTLNAHQQVDRAFSPSIKKQKVESILEIPVKENVDFNTNVKSSTFSESTHSIQKSISGLSNVKGKNVLVETMTQSSDIFTNGDTEHPSGNTKSKIDAQVSNTGSSSLSRLNPARVLPIKPPLSASKPKKHGINVVVKQVPARSSNVHVVDRNGAPPMSNDLLFQINNFQGPIRPMQSSRSRNSQRFPLASTQFSNPILRQNHNRLRPLTSNLPLRDSSHSNSQLYLPSQTVSSFKSRFPSLERNAAVRYPFREGLTQTQGLQVGRSSSGMMGTNRMFGEQMLPFFGTRGGRGGILR